MTTPPTVTTDLRCGPQVAAVIGAELRNLMAEDAADLDVNPLTVRLDRIKIGHDELWEALGALTAVLAPVLGSDPAAAVGDDQPEWQPDGGSPLAAQLALHASNASHLAARVRALTAAVDL